MSFVNLLDNVVWTDFDITNRTEAMVHSVVSRVEENILNRKVTGAQLGLWTLTNEEKALLQTYNDICLVAHSEGESARSDMLKLQLCLNYESALVRLSKLTVIEIDLNERESAESNKLIAEERLSLPEVLEPEFVTDENGVEIPNPAIEQDKLERNQAENVLSTALSRLEKPLITDPIIVTDMEGNETEMENSILTQDNTERTEAQMIVDDVTQDTLDLWNLRNPPPVVEDLSVYNSETDVDPPS